MRTIRWAFILFQCIWLNTVMPGHTRGVVTLPGSEASCHIEQASKCCPNEKGNNDSDSRAPTGDQKQRCAVCYFAAGLSTPPPVVFWQPVAGHVQILSILPVS